MIVSAPTLLLVVAVLGLAVGPLLARIWDRGEAWREALDGLSITLVGGICLFHLLPHAIDRGGVLAVVAGLAGVVMPLGLQRVGAGLAKTWTAAAFGLLAMHALFEGAALAVVTTGRVGLPLGLAVAAHRLPVGLAVYTAGARGGDWRGWAAVGVLMLATVAGFAVGAPLAGAGTDQAHGIFEALVAGVLLHIVFEVPATKSRVQKDVLGDAQPADAPREPMHGAHEHSAHEHSAHDHSAHDHSAHDHSAHDHGAPAAPAAAHDHGAHSHGGVHGHHHPTDAGRWSAWGALLGLILVGVVTAIGSDPDHGGGVEDHLATFFSLAMESAPALLIGYVLAGLITAFMPQGGASWMGGGSRLSQALRGVAFGLPLPVCSCGVLPLYESLVRRGVPAAAAVAFLVATPELGLDAVLLSVPLLGVPLTIARVLGAFLIALLVALLVSPSAESSAPAPSPAPALLDPVGVRLRRGLNYGLVELVDHTLPWVLLGLGVAAVAAPLLGHPALQQLPSYVQVPLFALIGIPIYVCASGATPVAAVAVQQGVSAGAALALLIAGPATNVTTFGVLSALHGRRMALRFGLAVVVLAIVAGWTVDAVGVSVPANVGAGAGEHWSLASWASLVGLALLTLASLRRQGPRGLLGQIVAPFQGH